MGKYFGTDGVRGVANLELTPEFVYKLGRAGAYVLGENKKNIPVIIICKDTRISGSMLEASLISGLCSVGAKVLNIGVAPTPAVPYLVKKYDATAGVVISASHNHFKDNGIKFFNSNGFKLSDEMEIKIENLIDKKEDDLPKPTGEKLGYSKEIPNAKDEYIDYLKTTINCDLKDLNVCIDCSNGATYKVAPDLFKSLGVNLITINNCPNGTNINLNCGSTHIESLIEKVKQNKGFVGFAFDGDGDRCIAVDENGEVVDGDQIMAICANYLKQNNKLKNNSIVATVMSNLGLSSTGEKNGFEVLKAKVGDRYVIEKMKEKEICFGGEQSGHIVFLDFNTTGDGLLTAIQLLQIIKNTKKPLSELKKIIKILPQVLININVDNAKKNTYLNFPEIKSQIETLENKFKNEGRILIRPSGTEPIIRIMVEGKDKDLIKKDAESLANLIKRFLK